MVVGSEAGEEGEGPAGIVEEAAGPAAPSPGGGGEALGQVAGVGDGDPDRHNHEVEAPAEDRMQRGRRRTPREPRGSPRDHRS